MKFCLDENLPHYVAEALSLVGYCVESSFRLGLNTWDDRDIILWLARNDYVWITKDETAKKEWLDSYGRLWTKRGVGAWAKRGRKRAEHTRQQETASHVVCQAREGLFTDWRVADTAIP